VTLASIPQSRPTREWFSEAPAQPGSLPSGTEPVLMLSSVRDRLMQLILGKEGVAIAA
jgi:hypothetical protein